MTKPVSSLRSFVDRVLRLKKAQDELGESVKEVYAEAKAARLDKTAMGQLVAYLRKREKNPHKLEENTAQFETYLAAYDAGTDHAREDTHAHETIPIYRASLPAHNPSTGELIEEPASALSEAAAGQGGGLLSASSVAPPTERAASPNAALGPVEPSPPTDIAPGPLPIIEFPDLPSFLRRSAA